MESKKQTAVEFLIKEFSEILGPLVTKPMQDLLMMDAMKQAKAIEKEQHSRTYNQRLLSNFQTFEHYWNETFKD